MTDFDAQTIYFRQLQQRVSVLEEQVAALLAVQTPPATPTHPDSKPPSLKPDADPQPEDPQDTQPDTPVPDVSEHAT